MSASCLHELMTLVLINFPCWMLMMLKPGLWFFTCRPVLGGVMGCWRSGGSRALILHIKKNRERGEGHSWFVWSITEITANPAGSEFLIVCVCCVCVLWVGIGFWGFWSKSVRWDAFLSTLSLPLTPWVPCGCSWVSSVRDSAVGPPGPRPSAHTPWDEL